MQPYPYGRGNLSNPGSTSLNPRKRPLESRWDVTAVEKSAFRQTARIRVKEVTPFPVPNPTPPPPQQQFCIHECFQCLADRVKALPRQVRFLIVKHLSASGINLFLPGLVIINGVRLFNEGKYEDHLQVWFAKRLKVAKDVGIQPVELYADEQGHTKARVMTGDQLIRLVRRMETKHRPEYDHEE